MHLKVWICLLLFIMVSSNPIKILENETNDEFLFNSDDAIPIQERLKAISTMIDKNNEMPIEQLEVLQDENFFWPSPELQ